MPKGIVAKIINIKHGSQGRSGSVQIGDSIGYITNSEKCDMKMDQIDMGQVSREVSYVLNDLKTLDGLYIGCRQVSDVSKAVDEMMQVKEFYQKTDGRVAMHGIISLDAEESQIENAGKLMLMVDDLMQELFPEHQVVYAVHTNTDNLHIHFIVNTVGLDGKKIHMDNEFMALKFHPAINKLAIKYGFTPNAEWEKEKEDEKLTIIQRKIALRRLIDHAIEDSTDFEAFIETLRKEGNTVNVGKYISIKTPDMVKAMRTIQLGDNYSVDSIKNRLKTKYDAFNGVNAESHAMEAFGREMLSYAPNVIKKYQNMTSEEKKKAIHMLKMGRNPWLIKIQGNWQMRQASEELSRMALVHEIIKCYSPGNNPDAAMKEIVERQKAVSKEIKAIKQVLSKYRPIIDLYEEMKSHMKKAYLYEAGYIEYKDDFEKCKEIEERILKGYGKTVLEVAEFIDDQKAQLLYAQGQKKELSEQYKTIKNYVAKELHRDMGEGLNLFAAIGHSEAKNDAYLYGLLQTRQVFITAEDAGGYLKVTTLPTQVDGKNTVVTTIEVMDETGAKVEEISSEDYSTKEFNQRIKELRDTYGYKKCAVHKDERIARSEMNSEVRRKVR